ncbi:MAG TPA: hypothetical protein VGO30_00545 [Mycobacterium sp.]|nr:hypothetical protein [Mycobacterium sp.]
MNSGMDYVATRRQLRGIAESLIAGPQCRAARTIRLAVRRDGFVGVTLPLAVHGTDFTWQDRRAPLTGSPGSLADAAGVDYGPPEGVYEIVDPLPADAVLDIDPGAAELTYRSLYAGGYALKQVLPESHPVLWPEHFDVAVTEDEVNYGVSAGDSHHDTPYSYVGPWTPRTGPFWNVPFGALLPLDQAHDVDQLADDVVAFFQQARALLRSDG